MTINNTANKVVAAGNGVMTVFNFSFVGVEASDISVIFTDANGNETVLASTAYSLTLNPAPPGQIWGIGGTVTYPLVGSPIALNTTLTIVRTVPLLQEVALGNQGNEFPTAVETALDLLMMALQQVSETFQRAIVAPVVDPSAPLPLPPAAQRANLALVFDAQGNPVAGAIPSSGVISSAMQPVVNAATLDLARTAFGLGSAAVENIGSYGLTDDGAGNLRQNLLVIQDASNQTVDKTFHLTQRVSSAPSQSVSLVYALPQASSLFNGFGFWVFAKSGNAQITPNGSDNFDGLSSGTAIAVPQGSWAWITTDGGSTWHVEYNNENVALQASAAGNALTITLNATAIRFRDTTLTGGDPVWQNIPANLTITAPSGASLGSPGSSTPFRIWVFLHRNGGNPVLGVVLASAVSGVSVTIFPVSSWETEAIGATAISAGATSAGTLYTSGAVTTDAVRMLGYVGFASGQASAGVWLTAPTKVQNLSPGMKRPGDVVQTVQAQTTATITPRSKENLVKVRISAYNNLASSGAIGQVQLTRNAANIGLIQQAGAASSSFVTEMPVAIEMYDAPNSTGALAYTAANVGGSPGTLNNILMIAEEIMG